MTEGHPIPVVDILAESLRAILAEPDVAMRSAKEAGFWRGAVRGLTRNYANEPHVLLAFLFEARDLYAEHGG